MNKTWLTLQELSEYLSFSKEKLYILLRQGSLPAVKVGRHWRFNRLEIDQWMLKQRSDYNKELELQ
ncbi:hypothetical protein A2291_06070 [candidate division WOR-1 bacterium RIFOXYB2_FULL_42_35]|uniref:Helix-turn-helix domain-containing protein n=1 Tax=candidate division WOR-1 bacterium RIFOXYC2_FULL_41_25 TaxID=1802586 RepID=A0A1F4TK15_UNCSA|nr:MAG: hypothetical protein A2247_01730 [candidate division WOR-1 bacterium RIFOXYA2_FULL_41_14]OGC22290.1 MAG: hypothetical protein A2291_06070 [candidate division WOR-1 bacterium RIFOXYB2_FULL_42_35]OGC32909.1 MAG: hypothetical protein A2462_00745 [candidate division WOR-1 bacterium RIFOXYC2_FULL_41_25]OGC41717.1 MAG: hypothetical protein A2548_04985 [candidate division WOR-1 bacterium RIFOXYD2_FULL_41_8]